MSDEVTPDSQQTATIRRSKNKLWLFLSIALILIIGIAITPAILRKIEKNRDAKCKDNLQQLFYALLDYSANNHERFPVENGIKGLEKLHGKYLTDYSFCCCPSLQTETIHGKLTDKDISYVYFGGFEDHSSDGGPHNGCCPVAFDRPGNHKDHINYLNEYGQIKTLSSKAQNCSEFIEEMNKEFNFNNTLLYQPEYLKILRAKAAEADRRYYSQQK